MQLPKHSIINDWVKALSITEVPESYAVATFLSGVGALLRRNVYFNQLEWKVYPNLSVLLVGPSGIGKDVAIRAIGGVVGELDETLEVGGKTMEVIVEQILQQQAKSGPPACALIQAPELTAFLGGKDYQKSMVQELTDILSTGAKVNVSLKSSPGMKRFILEPTLTMLGGSTEEWLQKAMPEGALEGGLLPRFLIICEEYGGRFIPSPFYSVSWEERHAAVAAKTRVREFLQELVAWASWPRDIVPLPEAMDRYTNWYFNRFKFFPPSVQAYANRSRDQLLRIAMLSAVMKLHNYIDEEDIEFGENLIELVAQRLDKAVKPQSIEARIKRLILSQLPASGAEVMKVLGKEFKRNDVLAAVDMLQREDVLEIQGRLWSRKGLK